MYKWRTLVLVLIVGCLTAMLAGCGGDGTQPDQIADSRTEGLPYTVLPAFPEDRAPSDDPPDDPLIRVVQGSEYLAMQNGTVDGTTLVLDAEDGDEYAWASYRISYLHGYRPYSLVTEAVPLDLYDEYFIGVANYTYGNWEWFGPTSFYEFEVDLSESDDQYISPLGNFYFIMLVQSGNTVTHTRSTLTCGEETENNPPEAPTDLVATDGDYADKVRLTWGASAGANGYGIWRTDSDGDGPDEEGWHVLDYTYYTLFDDFEVTVDEVYYYRVMAYNYGGYSPFSNVDSGYAEDPPPPPEYGTIQGSVIPAGDDFENMTVYMAGLPDVNETTPNIYGNFFYNNLPWGSYLVTIHHPQRTFYPRDALVTVSPEYPVAQVEFGATETDLTNIVVGYTWSYDPESGYVGLMNTDVHLERLGYPENWDDVTNNFGWFGFDELETNRYYRITPTRIDMLFAPENRTLYLGNTGYGLPRPYFFKGTPVP